MDSLHKIVLKNGTLDEAKIIFREKIYKGMNGRFVERLHITPSESYIFKPVTNDTQSGKEAWIYEHVLPLLPPIYPRMLAKSSSMEEELGWVIFEDLGTLSHVFSDIVAYDVIRLMAAWHAKPIEILSKEELVGPKPPIEKIAEDINSKKEIINEVAVGLGIPHEMVEMVFRNLHEQAFSTEKVLSHGDLHLGNYSLLDNRVVILDWEHLHLNSPHWDLYHLLDLSHPVFPRKMEKPLRTELLNLYIQKAQESGRKLDSLPFKKEYYLFATTFSLWMLLLIQGDLARENPKWSVVQLKNQLEETVLSFVQCAEEMQRLMAEEVHL